MLEDGASCLQKHTCMLKLCRAPATNKSKITRVLTGLLRSKPLQGFGPASVTIRKLLHEVTRAVSPPLHHDAAARRSRFGHDSRNPILTPQNLCHCKILTTRKYIAELETLRYLQDLFDGKMLPFVLCKSKASHSTRTVLPNASTASRDPILQFTPAPHPILLFVVNPRPLLTRRLVLLQSIPPLRRRPLLNLG